MTKDIFSIDLANGERQLQLYHCVPPLGFMVKLIYLHTHSLRCGLSLYRPCGAKEIHAVKGKMDENL